MDRRIASIPKDMSWENFLKKFGKFFPISKEAERIKKLEAEYERLTGRKPNEQTKGIKPTVRKAHTGGNGGKNTPTLQGSSKGSD